MVVRCSACLPLIQGGGPDDYLMVSVSAGVVFDGAVTSEDVTRWESELQGVLVRIGTLFQRKDSRRHAELYVRGLLSPLQRKNGWTIAEHVGEPEPKALQRFLNLSPWDGDALVKINRDYAMEHLAHPEAILVADPTGFAKKGTKSAGVQRQYSGTLGRVDNCQIATFLAYVTPDRDRALIDRRLYMPQESWLGDPDRCAEAGVPAELTFKTRPEQVVDMIQTAREDQMPFAWFTADEEFGQNPGLCSFLQEEQIPYVMAVPKNTQVTDPSGKVTRIDIRSQTLRRNTWQRRACGIGSKGHRVYDWALIDTNHPSGDNDSHHDTGIQYLIRRSVDNGEHAYYRCYNPNRVGAGQLVHVAGARWPIEECFGSAKNEVGLDNYQVRTWNAWHRHITLAMIAHTFLTVTAHHAKKGATNPTSGRSGRTHPQGTNQERQHQPTNG